MNLPSHHDGKTNGCGFRNRSRSCLGDQNIGSNHVFRYVKLRDKLINPNEKSALAKDIF